MSGEPIRWRALRLGFYCALAGVAALVLEGRTHLVGTHTVVGIGIKDSERTLLGTVAIVLFALAVVMVVGAVINEDWLARLASTPAVLLLIATIIGGALVFAAYRVQQDARHTSSGKPPQIQVDCPTGGGTCFSASGGGGVYQVPPSGYDPAYNCTWTYVGLNPAHTEQIYNCN